MATAKHPYYRYLSSGIVYAALTGASAGLEDANPSLYAGLDTYDPTVDDPTKDKTQAALAAERGDKSGYQSPVVAMTVPATTDTPTPPPILVHGLGQAIPFGDAPGIYTRGEPTQVVPGTVEVADGDFIPYTGEAPPQPTASSGEATPSENATLAPVSDTSSTQVPTEPAPSV